MVHNDDEHLILSNLVTFSVNYGQPWIMDNMHMENPSNIDPINAKLVQTNNYQARPSS